jgi:hypothetical protein
MKNIFTILLVILITSCGDNDENLNKNSLYDTWELTKTIRKETFSPEEIYENTTNLNTGYCDSGIDDNDLNICNKSNVTNCSYFIKDKTYLEIKSGGELNLIYDSKREEAIENNESKSCYYIAESTYKGVDNGNYTISTNVLNIDILSTKYSEIKIDNRSRIENKDNLIDKTYSSGENKLEFEFELIDNNLFLTNKHKDDFSEVQTRFIFIRK